MRELSIELLPDFGSFGQFQPAYGPGSVFQGFVCLSSGAEIEADHIRLQFDAVEFIHPFETSSSVARTKNAQVLFAVQHVLWKGRSVNSSSLTLPFTIQFPLMNYPPSVDHEYYQCKFKLTAFLENSYQSLQLVEKAVKYRPFVETCTLKNPIQATGSKVQVHALEYLPGDAISAKITTRSRGGAFGGSPSSKRIITAKLYQTGTVHTSENNPTLSKVIASQRWYENDMSEQDLQKRSDLKPPPLRVPYDAIPSFSFSNIFSVSYRLKVSVQKETFAGIWSSDQEIKFPVTIGTLSRGTHSPAQLRFYSTLSGEQRRSEVPQFMQPIRSTDTLPPYDNTSLPEYEANIL